MFSPSQAPAGSALHVDVKVRKGSVSLRAARYLRFLVSCDVRVAARDASRDLGPSPGEAEGGMARRVIGARDLYVCIYVYT